MENKQKRVVDLALELHELAKLDEIYAAISKAFDSEGYQLEQRIKEQEELIIQLNSRIAELEAVEFSEEDSIQEEEHIPSCLCDKCTCSGCGEKRHSGRCERK